MCVVSREESTLNVRCLHLTMNTIKDKLSFSVVGRFAPSGFFKKSKVIVNQPVAVTVRKPKEAATSVQAARLNGLLGRGTKAPL